MLCSQIVLLDLKFLRRAPKICSKGMSGLGLKRNVCRDGTIAIFSDFFLSHLQRTDSLSYGRIDNRSVDVGDCPIVIRINKLVVDVLQFEAGSVRELFRNNLL